MEQALPTSEAEAPKARRTITLIKREANPDVPVQPAHQPIAIEGIMPQPVEEGPALDVALIEQALSEIRPYIKMDGGDVELVRVDGKNIYVRLSGSCIGCQMASVTISGLRERLMLMLRTPVRLIPVK